MFVPGHTVVQAPDTEPQRTAVVLHGILGSWRNWRSFALRLAIRRPDWRFVLVDLRNHADSRGAPGPHTVRACAEDLLRLGVAPDAAIGHSFGGKVALEAALGPAASIRAVWMLDTPPGARDRTEGGRGDVEDVVAALGRVPLPMPTRASGMSSLAAEGLSPAIVQWLGTAIEADGAGGFTWRFDLDGVREMLGSYFETDQWPALEHPPPGLSVQVVAGERSDRWSAGDLERLRTLAGAGRIGFHVVPGAGHWLHADAPNALLDLLTAGLA